MEKEVLKSIIEALEEFEGLLTTFSSAHLTLDLQSYKKITALYDTLFRYSRYYNSGDNSDEEVFYTIVNSTNIDSKTKYQLLTRNSKDKSL